MRRSRFVTRVARSAWSRPLVVVLTLVLASNLLVGGGVPTPPSLMSRADVVTPKQRVGSAKGKPHLVSSKQTAAKADRRKRRPQRPKAAPPLSQDFEPRVVEDSKVKRPKPPGVKTVPEPEPVKVTGFDEKKSVEDPSRRGRYEEQYKNPDGTWTARFFTRPVHYKDGSGQWQRIDSSLVASPDGWRNKSDESRISFAARTREQDLASMELGGGKRFGFGVSGVADVQGQGQGASVTYRDVRPGADLVLRSLNGGSVKEEIILKSPEAPAEWEFPLRTDGLTPRMASDGSVELVDAKGAVTVAIPHGFMVDSKIDPRSGDPVRSEAVAYALEQRGRMWVLKVSADREWLADPERVYPVTIDPTAVDYYDDSADTYVQTGYGSSPYQESELKAGTYNGGSTKAATYLAFSQLDNVLAHSKIYDARLYLWNYWSYSCTAAPVSVHPVTQSWSQSSIAAYPGPSYGGALASRSFAHGWTDGSGAASPCPAKWEGIDLGSAGNKLVQGWVDGKPNYGLTVRASSSSSSGWKKFSSREVSGGGPYMSIVYSPYNATYAFAADPPAFNPPVLNNQAGNIQLKVTNKGHETWTPTNGYKVTYGVYDKNGKQIWHEPAKTAMPSNVAYGQTVTVNAKVNPLPPGTWTVRFDIDAITGAGLFSLWGVPRTAAVQVTVPDIPTQLNEMKPANNYEIGTLTPQLFADAQSVDAWPSANVNYQFTLCAPPWFTWSWCLNSPWQQTPKWTVPNTDATKRLEWGKEYYWTVSVSDSGGATTDGPWYKLATGVPQPSITSSLGASHSGAQEFDQQVGNYLTSETDAQVAAVGPPLSVIRNYNSLDPRTSGLFGAGWTSRYDMKVVPDNDSSGNVVITYPSGQEVRFGKNPDGGYAPPTGVFATLTDVTGGGWKLRDKTSTIYLFDGSGRLTSVTDHRGRGQTLTYGTDGKLSTVTTTGGRALHFTWSGSHVQTVSTDAVNGSPLTWTYTYTGDTLAKVCPPTSATACTTYAYGPGSHYRTTVLDDNPTGYWRLNETSGTTANNEVPHRLNADKGVATAVTWGGAGALAGTTNKAVTFTGNGGRVGLPNRFINRESGYLAVEAWFKTTSVGVILSYQNSGIGSVPTKYTPAIYVGTDGYLRAQFWNGTANPMRASAAAVNDGQWHHVVLSGEGDIQTLYLDGAAVRTRTGTIDHDNQPIVYVGNGYTGGGSAGWHYTPSTPGNFPFTGTIDEVAVYDKPLGPPAVQQHYTARLAAQQLTQVNLPSGRAHAVNTYDTGQDRLATHTDQNGGTWQLGTPAYSGTLDDPVKTVTLGTPGGGTAGSTYEPLRGNRLTSETDQLGKKTTYAYDTAGQLAKITDRNGNVTDLWFDERGNKRYQQRCRDADTCYAEYWSYSVNADDPFDPANDQLTQHADGRTLNPYNTPYYTAWTYDAYGQKTSEVWAATEDHPYRAINYAYTDGTEPAIGGGTTPAGLLKTRSNAFGHTVYSYAYTSAGDLAQITDAAGKVTNYGYDAVGRRTSETVITDAYPQGVTTTYGYDALGHPTRQTAPGVLNEITNTTHTAETTFAYDVDGNLLTQTFDDKTGGDPARTTTYTYNDRGLAASVTDPEGATEHYTYDSTGARVGLTDKLGTTYTFGYTTRGELAAKTLKDWTGNPDNPISARDVVTDSYAYDDGGRLASHTDVMGRTTAHTYYGDDRLAQTVAKGAKVNDSSTPADIVLESNSYDGAGNLTSQISGDGKYRVDYTYDEAGQRNAEIVDPDGVARRTDYAFDNDNNIAKATTSAAGIETTETTSYVYDDLDRVTRQTVENGDQDLTTTYSRDQRGLLTAVVEPRGNASGAVPSDYTTNIRYDAAGRSVEVSRPAVQVERAGGTPATVRPTMRYGYNTAGESTHASDPEGRITSTGYDKAGRPTAQTLPAYTPPGSGTALTPTATIEYNAAGLPSRRTDPRGNSTTFAYDALANLVHTDDPVLTGHNEPGRWAYEYDLAGELLATTDPMGARTEATYDDLGRQITQTIVERRPSAAAYTTRLSYDMAGHLTAQTSPTGDTTAATVDGAGQITEITNPLGKTSTVAYDATGRTAKITGPLGNGNETLYDHAGRVTTFRDFDSAGTELRNLTFGYDLAGNRTSETDAEGHTTTYTYDAGGRMTGMVEPVAQGQTITTGFGYNAADQRTRLTDGRGNTTIYTYNSLRLPEATIEPATTAHPNAADRTWTTIYDAGGNPVRQLKPGGATVNRTFDELGRVTQETGSGAEAATTDKVFGYDLAGNRLRVSAPGNDILTTYNDRGLPLTTSSPTGQTAQFTYDANGRVTSRTDVAGQASFTWNGNGLLATSTDDITGATANYSYDDASRISGIAYGATGTNRTYTYDALNRTADDVLKDAGGNTLASIGYTYDKNDRLTGKTTTGTSGAGSNSYTYDHAGRLTGWTNPAGTTTSYTWDAAGNRTSAGSTTSTYDQRNRLTAAGSTSFTYTPRGTTATQVSSSTRTYSFDAYDRMITDAGGTVVDYTYDALDRAATRTESGATTNFSNLIYSTDQNDVTATTDSAGTVKAAYTRTPDGGILNVRQYGTPYWGISDRHDDLVGLLNTSATALAGSVAFDPFGKTTSTTGTTTRAGYQGEYTDVTTGRVNMHARWYNPNTGSFNARDDWNLSSFPSVQSNRYAYGNGDPLDNGDPSGHVPIPSSRCNYPSMNSRPNLTLIVCGGQAVRRAKGGVGYGGTGGSAVDLYQKAAEYRAIDNTIKFYESFYSHNIWAPQHPVNFAPGSFEWSLGRCDLGDMSGCLWNQPGTGQPGSGPGGGGPGPRPVPPPPTPAQIQARQAREARDNPGPRPALKNPISQSDLNKKRNAIERRAGVGTGRNDVSRIVDDANGAFRDRDANPATSPSAGGGAPPGVGVPVAGGGGNGSRCGPGEIAAPDGRCVPALKDGDTGRFGDLDRLGKVGDNLTPHHIPQNALGFLPREDGGAIMMPHDAHALTRTYWAKGRITKAQDAGLSFRDVLAKDLWDMRKVGKEYWGNSGHYNESIKKLLKYYRDNYPGLMARG